MSSEFKRRLDDIKQPSALALLGAVRRGIEKESLRVDPRGNLAQTRHPLGLGSPLTHSMITTDYSEALLEFITPICDGVGPLLHHLDEIHRFVYGQLGDELLWTASMPCLLGDDEQIPLAQYGSSNVAKMKTSYRHGLGARYGRRMQTISGIHYNFSLDDEFWRYFQLQEGHSGSLQTFKTERYFDLIRNFRRYFWLLLFLFGASPAVCGSFLQGREPDSLQRFGKGTLVAANGTSLRMGDLGYQSNAQSSLVICYNSLENYVETLKGALTQPFADYQKLGVRQADGSYTQLSDALLQIENEFYSVIRPKRVAHAGETPLHGLATRGVEYIEVRCLDVDPFQPLGISAEQVRFLDAFLLFCLFADSPTTDAEEYLAIADNQHAMVYAGRDASLRLNDKGRSRSLPDWGGELLQQIAQIAQLLDQANCLNGEQSYVAAVQSQQAKLNGETLTPGGQMLAMMNEKGADFFDFAMQQSQQHADYFRQRPLTGAQHRQFTELARESLIAQRQVEDSDQLSFEEYLQQYYSQYAAL